MLSDNKLTYSVKQVAEVLDVSKDLVYAQIRCGRLKHKRMGRLMVISREWLLEYLSTPEPAWQSVDAPSRR